MTKKQNRAEHRDQLIERLSKPLGFDTQALIDVEIGNVSPANLQLLELFIVREINDLAKGYGSDEAGLVAHQALQALDRARQEIVTVIEKIRAASLSESLSNSSIRVLREADNAYHMGEGMLDDVSLKRDERGDTLADYLHQVLFSSIDAQRRETGSDVPTLSERIAAELGQGILLLERCANAIEDEMGPEIKNVQRSKIGSPRG